MPNEWLDVEDVHVAATGERGDRGALLLAPDGG